MFSFFSSRRRHTRCLSDWSSDVCSSDLGCLPLRGNGSLEKVALGPTNTSSSSVMPSQIWTPILMVTRSPMRTSFSMKVWSQMLQRAPITAPGRTWANAQMRVPAPIEGLSTIAVSCWKKASSANAGLLWESLQGAHHGGYFVVQKFGVAGQGENLAGRLLGGRQWCAGREGGSVCPTCRHLEVIRHGVVDVRGDAARGERGSNPIALRAADHIEMGDVAFAEIPRAFHGLAGQRGRIGGGDLTAARVPAFEVRQLGPQDGGLHLD